jgi:molybdate transport system substrate-binding protein
VKRQIVSVVVVAAGLIACGPGRDGARGPRPQLRVAAAADLSSALGEIAARFTAAQEIEVAASYGSSGTLYAQLLNGAPFDLFLSADAEYPRQLAARGLSVEDGEFRYAVGRLAVWTAKSSHVDLQADGVRSVAGPGVNHVSVANPAHAPYGRAAIAALRAAGVYENVKSRLIYGENVAQAMQFVQSGAADVGLVAVSLVLAPGARDQGRWVEVPAGDYPPLEQAGVIMKQASDIAAARAFAAFLRGDVGRSILQQNGFSVPER